MSTTEASNSEQEIAQEPKEDNKDMIKLAVNVDSFLNLRYEETGIHPSKDPAITFLCRVLKHFLLSDDYRLYYKRLITALQDDYGCNKSITKIKAIFNSIKGHRFMYLLKNRKNKQKHLESRCFMLDSTHQAFEDGIEQMQKFRELLKYGAWSFKDGIQLMEEQKKRQSYDWEFIGYGTENEEEDCTYYNGITNGFTVFHVNDVVECTHSNGVSMRPWIARIVGFIEHNDGRKRLQLRWLWFYNQILEHVSIDEEDEINAKLRKLYGDGFPVGPGVIFEEHVECKLSDEPPDCMKNVVFLTNSKGRYRDLVNAKDIFQCDYFVNVNKQKFIKKTPEQMKKDNLKLFRKVQSRNNRNNNNNRNNVRNKEDDDEESSENDDDLDMEDIEMVNNKVVPPTFTKRKKHGATEEENDDDIPEDDDLDSDTL